MKSFSELAPSNLVSVIAINITKSESPPSLAPKTTPWCDSKNRA
jgi:hypothetical protein